MVPKGWKSLILSDLFDFKNGINAGKERYGKGVRFVNIMEIINNNYLVTSKIPGMVEVDKKSQCLYSVKYGDVLFNRTSETQDEIGLSSVYLDQAEVVFGGFVIRARPKDKTLNANFCKYCFSSLFTRQEIVKRGQGVVRANIGQGDLGTVPLLVPPLKEQEKIAKILLSWDEAIEKLERIVELKKIKKKHSEFFKIYVA